MRGRCTLLKGVNSYREQMQQELVKGHPLDHLVGTSSRSGFPFSTIYVASSAALLLPTFFAAWIVPAGMNKTSPALSVTGGLPST
jgi:hypothetical protein